MLHKLSIILQEILGNTFMYALRRSHSSGPSLGIMLVSKVPSTYCYYLMLNVIRPNFDLGLHFCFGISSQLKTISQISCKSIFVQRLTVCELQNSQYSPEYPCFLQYVFSKIIFLNIKYTKMNRQFITATTESFD